MKGNMLNKHFPAVFCAGIGILLSSCASILNEQSQKVQITHSPVIHLESVNGQEPSIGQRKFLVKRDTVPLLIRVRMDSAEREIKLRSTSSFNYLVGNLFTYGVGYFIERNYMVRYGYPRFIHLEKKNETIRVTRFGPRKGRLNLSIGMPYLNMLYVQAPDRKSSSIGFMGLSAGLEYFYHDFRFVSVSGGWATDFLLPFPAPYDPIGTYEAFGSDFISFRHNHCIGDWRLGYGVSLANSIYNLTYQFEMDSTVNYGMTKTTGLGLSFSMEYQVGRSFHIGLLYQPMLWNLKEESFDYQHLISIEIAWKIRLMGQEE